MEQLHLLLFLSFSMLVGSFFSGYVPMAFKMSDSKSRLLALMGSGILVGTALAIIIPEGIDSIYAQPDPLASESSSSQSPDVSGGHHTHSTLAINSQSIIPPEPVQTWIIGISLVAGFVLMLLIDQFSLYQSGGDSFEGHSNHQYVLANREDEADDYDEGDANSDVADETLSETKEIRAEMHKISMRGIDINNSHQNGQLSPDTKRGGSSRRTAIRAVNTKVTPTLGLVIHASADGIALGAAATTSHRHVEMIIFLAIMLHKAPAAFSLVVFLLHRGLKHSTIRRHLLAFSLSAPLAALLTYFGLSQSGKEALRRNNATGIAMLFSAGTFLYVATVHVLPELVHNRLLSPKELMFVVGGAFLPILLAQTI